MDLIWCCKYLQHDLVLSVFEGELFIHVMYVCTDVLHPVDVVEDVGIAFGYNDLNIAPPPTNCPGASNVRPVVDNAVSFLTDKPSVAGTQ